MHKKVCVCVFVSAADTPTTARLLPSAPFRRHDFNRLIITVNHRRRPVGFFLPRRQSPLCSCPPPPTPLSQISYSRRGESSRGERQGGEEGHAKGLAWLSGSSLALCRLPADRTCCRFQQSQKNEPRADPCSAPLAALLGVVTPAPGRGQCCLSLSPVAGAGFPSLFTTLVVHLCWGGMLKSKQENMK